MFTLPIFNEKCFAAAPTVPPSQRRLLSTKRRDDDAPRAHRWPAPA